MAIKHRRGNYGDFDPARMQQAELAVVLKNDTHSPDGKSAYIAFNPNDVKRIAMMEDITEELENAVQGVADTATAQADAAATRAETAATNAAASAASAASILSNVYTKSEVDAAIASIEIDVDDTLSNSSTNPVQNKVIKGAIDELNGSLDALEETVNNIGFSDDVKSAILACFRNSMMINSVQGAAAYDDLYNLFYDGNEPINATDVMSMFGFTLSGLNSGGSISFSAMKNGSAFVFAPNVNRIKGTLSYSSPEYDYGRLFIFRTVSDTVLYGILSKSLVKLTLNKTTNVYSITTDASIAELTTSESTKRASSYVDLRLSNGVLTGYDKNGNIDFTVTNANCIGFWGNNVTGIPSATLKRNVINTRAMTIEDVDSALGYSGLSVTAGAVSVTSQKSFSVFVLSATSIRSKLNFVASGRTLYKNFIVYKKLQDGSFWGTNGDTDYLFTYDPTNEKYSATTMTTNTDIKVRPNGDRTGENYQATLINGTLYCFNANQGILFLIENANCMGVYSGTSPALNKFVVEVQENA